MNLHLVGVRVRGLGWMVQEGLTLGSRLVEAVLAWGGLPFFHRLSLSIWFWIINGLLPSPYSKAGEPRVPYNMAAGFQNSKGKRCPAVKGSQSITSAIKPIRGSLPPSQSSSGEGNWNPPPKGKSGICLRKGKDVLSALFEEYQLREAVEYFSHKRKDCGLGYKNPSTVAPGWLSQ